MTTTNSMIRLVGGPRMLDRSTHDLSRSPHDRADAGEGRFVRAVRNSTAMSLSALQSRCPDRETADELARTWAAAVFRPGRPRRARARIYRFEGTYLLTPTRDHDGRWALVPGARVTGSAPPPAASTGPAWGALEQAVDQAADRFTRVAALVPEGPLADRASATRRAVATCVADAARLCGVGLAVAPDWQPGVPGGRAAALAARVVALVGTIDEATAHLVDLHLEIGDRADPVGPVAHLGAAWAELGGNFLDEAPTRDGESHYERFHLG
jgi:hypothetical protein